MTKSSFPVLMAALIFLLFSANAAFGQCGLPGTPPCPPAPKKTTPKKNAPKPTVAKPKTPAKVQPKTTPEQKCSPSDNNDAPDDSAQIIHNVKFEMVGIPSGSFCMGEKPVHRVNIGRAFNMGKYEVTQAQWQTVMGDDPGYFSNCGGNCPVEQVSWGEVKEFIHKLNNLQSNHTYRLPTEAEWEYAARAGTIGDYAGSLDSMAWYSSNSGDKTHEVGTKSPNGWGLYDMQGNVWEWVEDWFGKYPNTEVTDPTGAASGSLRVLRGGSWSDNGKELRSAFRSSGIPGIRRNYLGFRLVRN